MKAGDQFQTEPHYRGGRRNMAFAPFSFDFEATYVAEGWGEGIAWRAFTFETEPDEDTEWSGYETTTGLVLAHMVGDDRPFGFDPAELTAISEDAYCSGCGQIGCGWGH